MATTTKKNRVVTFTTSEGAKNKKAIPIEFRIEITPEKDLESITARDSEGIEYVVSLALLSKKHGYGLCCCKTKNKKIYYCYPIPAGGKCSCKH